MTKLFDRQPIVSWQEAGEPTMEDRVKENVRDIIENHQPETLNDRITTELERLCQEGEKEILAKYVKG